jgi:hypothetical protein
MFIVATVVDVSCDILKLIDVAIRDRCFKDSKLLISKQDFLAIGTLP